MHRLAVVSGILLAALVLWAGVTENTAVWPIRNTAEYQINRIWREMAGEPDRSRTGEVSGRICSQAGLPLVHAVVTVAEWDGRVHSSRTDAQGFYAISGIPAGTYRIAAAAPGFVSAQTEGILPGITIGPERPAQASFKLKPESGRPGLALGPLSIRAVETLRCTSPVAGAAVRAVLQFSSTDRSTPVFYYRPLRSETSPLPVLFAVYPGPVDTWECVSIGLTQAGYAVLAVGPEYRLELADDVDWLAGLLKMVRRGELPEADTERIAALGGSYSALLLELLMLRDTDLSAVVLLGPPADMFDFRRRFERENFLPPFGLDRALVALGAPNRDPLRYLRCSAAYHVRAGLPPTLLFHSYQDEIVPYQQSRLLADSLHAAGVATELHLFDGASHYLLADDAAAQVIYHDTIDFLSRHGIAPFSPKEKIR